MLYLHTDAGLGSEELTNAVAELSKVANDLQADYVLLRCKSSADGTQSAEYLIRKKAEVNDFKEVRVAVVGNVDAGKNNLLGVCCTFNKQGPDSTFHQLIICFI